MPLTGVPCAQCGEQAGGFKVGVPNPDRGWCKYCHQEIGPIIKEFFFCSPKCMWKWIEGYHQSEPYLIKEYLRDSCQKMRENK